MRRASSIFGNFLRVFGFQSMYPWKGPVLQLGLDMTGFTLLIAALLLAVPGSGQVNDEAKTYLNPGVQGYR